jgi:hypothetical protein
LARLKIKIRLYREYKYIYIYITPSAISTLNLVMRTSLE